MSLPYPFLHPAFFSALESTGAASAATGWHPHHFQQGEQWMPLYLKTHNRGEYVFDHAWAQAYARHGLAYFPRLLTAVPFSPLTGPRWRGTPAPAELRDYVVDSAARTGASSWHLLFPDAATREALQDWPLAQRQACHFRWFNRGYRDFDDFLGHLTSRRRKSMRRERQRLQEAGIRVEQASGAAIPAHWWPDFYQCYASTYLKRGQHPYLGEDFFRQLATSALGEQVLLMRALDAGGRVLAMAFYLFDSHTLYGRYWGSLVEVDGLHFELCYYRGMEFCMARGLTEFDPGVQGEHKILRGFEPVITWSLHWCREPAFQQAVEDFCKREAEYVSAYQQEARALLPYRQA